MTRRIDRPELDSPRADLEGTSRPQNETRRTSDLTPEEQANAKAALRFPATRHSPLEKLRGRSGRTWGPSGRPRTKAVRGKRRARATGRAAGAGVAGGRAQRGVAYSGGVSARLADVEDGDAYISTEWPLYIGSGDIDCRRDPRAPCPTGDLGVIAFSRGLETPGARAVRATIPCMAGKQKKATPETSTPGERAKFIQPQDDSGSLAERTELPRAKSLSRPAPRPSSPPSEPPPSRDVERDLRAFVNYARTCSDEKGDAQVFCDRLFRAFGHAGYKEAGAVLEDRVKMQDGRTKFADLVWRPRVLIEMKKRGEKLARHYAQAMQYWIRLTPDRPRYVMLCNFNEFWIYDF